MKKFQIILAYYTLIVSTALLIWAIFVSSRPESFLVALLFIPCGIYFWATAAGIIKADFSKDNMTKTVPFFLMALLASSLSALIYSGVISYSNKSQKQVKTIQTEYSSDRVTQRLDNLTQEVEKLSTKPVQPVPAKAILGQSDQKINTITLKEKPETTPVNIYKEKSTSSEVVGTAEFGKPYIFLSKDDSWYLVYENNKEGYIESSMVKEVLY